jgi:benzoyl-CoA reductase subunit A
MTMKYYVGIDLGSTTTKAVIVDGNGTVLGRGITNSRSNYDVACQVSLGEALTSTRLSLLKASLSRHGIAAKQAEGLLKDLELSFRRRQYDSQLRALHVVMERERAAGLASIPAPVLEEILQTMLDEAPELFTRGANRKSDFFRDLSGSRYLALAEVAARNRGIRYDALISLFDKSILEVENDPRAAGDFRANMKAVLSEQQDLPRSWSRPRASAPDMAAPACRSRRRRFDRRYCATVLARTRCFPALARCWTSAARTPRPFKSTRMAW